MRGTEDQQWGRNETTTPIISLQHFQVAEAGGHWSLICAAGGSAQHRPVVREKNMAFLRRQAMVRAELLVTCTAK